MKRIAKLCSALLLLLAVGVITATTASAESTPLPTIHTALPGEKYPLNLGGHCTCSNELRNESGNLTGKEFSILLQVLELTALGPATIEFSGIEEPKEKAKCGTAGDAPGVTLIPNAEFHLVYTNLSPAAPLEVGAVMLFSKFVMTCGVLETVITGPSTARINVTKPTLAEGDSTDLETVSQCANTTTDIQEISSYYNDNLELVATTLLANISGTGIKKSCELIAGTVLLTPETGSSAAMFSALI